MTRKREFKRKWQMAVSPVTGEETYISQGPGLRRIKVCPINGYWYYKVFQDRRDGTSETPIAGGGNIDSLNEAMSLADAAARG